MAAVPSASSAATVADAGRSRRPDAGAGPSDPRRRRHARRLPRRSFAAGLAPVAPRYGSVMRNGGIVGCGVTATDEYKLAGEVTGFAQECADWQTTWKRSLRTANPGAVTVASCRHARGT